VYVETLCSYFYASSADEEDDVFLVAPAPIAIASTVLEGIVTAGEAASCRIQSASPAIG
jgi:hypothetical protein